MSHSKIILPDHLVPKDAAVTARGKSLASLDQVVNIAGNLTGPIAVTLDEAMVKIARLEDHAGIDDAVVAAETANPTGTGYATTALIKELLGRVTALEDALLAYAQHGRMPDAGVTHFGGGDVE